jgi:hypothetical protein
MGCLDPTASHVVTSPIDNRMLGIGRPVHPKRSLLSRNLGKAASVHALA